jgi:minichromosome maintenance protein 10
VGGDAGGDTTYVVSGHIIRSGADPRDSMHIAENMGREGQAKARRKMLSRDTDRALKALFDRDRDGMQAVVKAREAGHAQKAEKREGSSKGKGKGKAKEGEVSTSKTAQKVGAEPKAPSTKNAYSAEIIKQLGFDPTVKAGHRRYEDDVMKKKVGPHILPGLVVSDSLR